MHSASLYSAIVIGGWAFVLTVLERLFPYQKDYAIFRKGYWMDLFWYTFVQNYLLGIFIAWLITCIDKSAQVSRLHLLKDWSVWQQWLLFLVTHDFFQYWFHRFEHNNKFFWRVHEAAHATPEVDWLVGSRSHFIEILVAQTVEYAPLILLGASADVAILKATTDAVWGMFNHSNINVKMSKLLFVFNGPELHRWHHSVGLKVNFSTKFSVWDWLFGTMYYPKEGLPKYGLAYKYPYYSYFKQIWYVFRKFK